VVGIVVLGTAQLFEKHVKVETYVDESVQGLDVGAPVKFRESRSASWRRSTSSRRSTTTRTAASGS